MSNKLRMNNDELRMALALMLVVVCLACVVLFVKRYDWDTVPRVSNVDLKAQMNETKVQYCPNPIHKTEGK